MELDREDMSCGTVEGDEMRRGEARPLILAGHTAKRLMYSITACRSTAQSSPLSPCCHTTLEVWGLERQW